MHQSPKEHPSYYELIRKIRTNDVLLRSQNRGDPLSREREKYVLLQRQQERLYTQLEFWNELDLLFKYDTDQPRVPPGHPDGGQWTNGSGGIDPIVTGATLGDSVSQPGNNSWIGRTEQFARQIDREIPLPAIVRSNPIIRSAASLLSFLKTPELEYPLAEALQQYNAIVATEDPYVVPFIAMRANQCAKDETKIWASVCEVDKDTVCKFCPSHWEIQIIANNIASTIGPMSSYRSPQNYGTQFHLRAANVVRGLGDPTLIAELYLMAPLEGAPASYYRNDVGTREAGSLGLDVYEEVGTDLTCIYDFKTGKTALDATRMGNFAYSSTKTFPDTKQFFVIEIKPRPDAIKE